MNNDDETNDANDNGNRIIVAQPETERQELLRLRLELARGQQQLEAERLEAERVLQGMVLAATRSQLPQVQAFVAHVATEQHQQAESAEDGGEENADTVSSPIVESSI